jgi:predicted nucleic acid-binding Zn ribbon protein
VAANISNFLVDVLCRTDNELPEDDVFCTETCRSYFNVNFNIVFFKTTTCAFVGE